MCATASALVLPLEKIWKVREHVVIACSFDRSITVILIEEIEAIQSNPSRFFDSMFLSRGLLRLAVEDSLCMSLAHPIPIPCRWPTPYPAFASWSEPSSFSSVFDCDSAVKAVTSYVFLRRVDGN